MTRVTPRSSRPRRTPKRRCLEDVSVLAERQQLLWASGEHAVLIILQALDAAGKDGIIRHVMSGLNPQGVDVFSFKAPTDEETRAALPVASGQGHAGAGRIAIFNRSYYEEVLVVRVHPEFLSRQWVPRDLRDGDRSDLWQRRFDEINAFERLMTENGIEIIKFFLNVSKAEQRGRLLERLTDPQKHWKYSAQDIEERQHWDEYQHAYEQMLSHTSTDHAPWHIIPADRKWFTRAAVADIITERIEALDLSYPTISDEEQTALAAARRKLEAETD